MTGIPSQLQVLCSMYDWSSLAATGTI